MVLDRIIAVCSGAPIPEARSTPQCFAPCARNRRDLFGGCRGPVEKGETKRCGVAHSGLRIRRVRDALRNFAGYFLY